MAQHARSRLLYAGFRKLSLRHPLSYTDPRVLAATITVATAAQILPHGSAIASSFTSRSMFSFAAGAGTSSSVGQRLKQATSSFLLPVARIQQRNEWRRELAAISEGKDPSQVSATFAMARVIAHSIVDNRFARE